MMEVMWDHTGCVEAVVAGTPVIFTIQTVEIIAPTLPTMAAMP